MSTDHGDNTGQNVGGGSGEETDDGDPEEPLTSIWDSRFIVRVPGGWKC